MICTDCALERGYRWPMLDNEVCAKLCPCEMCSKRVWCFDLDQLWKSWEDQPHLKDD
jgi:hypothetical protein